KSRLSSEGRMPGCLRINASAFWVSPPRPSCCVVLAGGILGLAAFTARAVFVWDRCGRFIAVSFLPGGDLHRISCHCQGNRWNVGALRERDGGYGDSQVGIGAPPADRPPPSSVFLVSATGRPRQVVPRRISECRGPRAKPKGTPTKPQRRSC